MKYEQIAAELENKPEPGAHQDGLNLFAATALREQAGMIKASDAMQSQQLEHWREKLHIPDSIQVSSDLIDDLCEHAYGLQQQLAAEKRDHERTISQWRGVSELPEDAQELYKIALQSITIHPDKTHSCLDKLMIILAEARARADKAEEWNKAAYEVIEFTGSHSLLDEQLAAANARAEKLARAIKDFQESSFETDDMFTALEKLAAALSQGGQDGVC